MLSTRRALRSSSCRWCRGEFGGTQPWGNCARRGLARSVIACGWRKANAKPFGKPRDFWATAGPWEGGTHCPYFIQRFVRGLQMRWQGDLWLRWPKGNASPARALPTLPTLHPNLLAGFVGAVARAFCISCTSLCGLPPPRTARESRNHLPRPNITI